jgi:hypothetical protein
LARSKDLSIKLIQIQETNVKQKVVRHGGKLTALAACAALAACGGGGGDSGNLGGLLQLITFDFPKNATLGIGPVKLNAVASSGLPVQFKSGTPEVCSVSGDAVTPLKTGECLVYADQPGGKSADGTTWAAADTTNQLFKVLKGTQTVAFPLPNYLLSTDSLRIPLSAKAKNSLGADSGTPITYTVSTPNVCSVSGAELVLNGKGLCAVTAAQAGTADYEPASIQGIVAVDPVLIADGFNPATLGTGKGTNSAIRTKQGGAVSVNAWHWSIGNAAGIGGGWESCDSRLGDWCYQVMPEDGSALTSALHTLKSANQGWDNGSAFNRIDIFTPGVTSLAWNTDTNGGKQVTTEQSMILSVEVSDAQVATKKPLHVELVLSKNDGNGGCNVTLSAPLFPVGTGMRSYAIPLSWFATTAACGTGATSVSLDTVRGVPFYDPAVPDPFLAALDKDPLKAARTSAANLLKTYPTVQLRIRNHTLQFSTESKDSKGNVIFNNDLKVGGFIALI